jgi:hypothetical protein
VRSILLAALALLLLPGMVMAQGAVSAELEPVSSSGVSGTARLTAAGAATDVTLDVRGLEPGADALAFLRAGSCDLPSASFAALPDLKADATGRATATGPVLYQGREKVALSTLADGEHIIAIQSGGRMLACGVIPGRAAAWGPATLPHGGAANLAWSPVTAGALGSCAVFAGLLLRRRSRS